MIIGGEDPGALAKPARGSLRRKRAELAAAVPGLIRDHHRFLLRDLLDTIDHLSGRITALDVRIETATRPFSPALEILESVPGVRRRSAEAILAEIGDDMKRFPTPRHLASWARICPGNHESAGKRRPSSTGKGNTWLRDALSQVAWGAARTKTGYYRKLYYRHRSRGGPKKAIVVVQHAILTAIWHMLSTGTLHEDLGPDHFQRRQGPPGTPPPPPPPAAGGRCTGAGGGCLIPETTQSVTKAATRRCPQLDVDHVTDPRVPSFTAQDCVLHGPKRKLMLPGPVRRGSRGCARNGRTSRGMNQVFGVCREGGCRLFADHSSGIVASGASQNGAANRCKGVVTRHDVQANENRRAFQVGLDAV